MPPLVTRLTTSSPRNTGSLPITIARGSASTTHASVRSRADPRASSASAPMNPPPSRTAHARARLHGIVLGRDVGAPRSVGLLDPQRVDRAIPRRHEPVRRARLHQRVPQVHGELAARVQLPPVLADVGHPQRPARRIAHRHPPRLHEPERQIVGAHAREHLARARAPQAQARHATTSRRAPSRRTPRCAPEPCQVVRPERRPGHQQEAILGQPRHRQVALDARRAG